MSTAQLRTLNQLDQMRQLVLEGKSLSIQCHPAAQLHQILQADLKKALQTLVDKVTPLVAFKQLIQPSTSTTVSSPPPTIVWKTLEGIHIPTKQNPGCSSERVVYKTFQSKVSKGSPKKSRKRSISVDDEDDDLVIVEEQTNVALPLKKRKCFQNKK